MEEEEWPIENGKVSLFAIRRQQPSCLRLPADSPHPSPSPRTPAWLWPHTLSLEAPLVAMLWLAALAKMDDLALMPGVLLGLGLAVWLIYLADRVLDAWGVPEAALSVRHLFYRRFRWPLVLGVIPAGTAYLLWLALWVVPSGLLAHSLTQVLPIALYLVLYSVTSIRLRRWLLQAGILLLLFFINALPLSLSVRVTISLLIATGTIILISLRWHENLENYFRKELAAGLLFAFGCTTWTRFHTLGSEGPENWVQLILLGLLFISNLATINAREVGSEENRSRAQSTLRGSIALCLLALLAIPLDYLPASLLPQGLAIGAGLIGTEIVWQNRHRLSPEAFRVWADIAVAAPALVVLLLPESGPAQSAACCM